MSAEGRNKGKVDGEVTEEDFYLVPVGQEKREGANRRYSLRVFLFIAAVILFAGGAIAASANGTSFLAGAYSAGKAALEIIFSGETARPLFSKPAPQAPDKIAALPNISSAAPIKTPAKNIGIAQKKTAARNYPQKQTAADVIAPSAPQIGGHLAETAPPEKYFTVSIIKTGDGRGVIQNSLSGAPEAICSYDCATYSNRFAEKTALKLTAVPRSDSIFAGWNSDCAGSAECNISATKDLSIVAEFQLSQSAAPQINPRSHADSQNQTISPAKIFISEILFNPEGSDAGKEFIEIYNAGNADTDIKDWSLKITAPGGQPTSLAKIGGSKNDKTSIRKSGFFLIGFNGYSSSPVADAKRSASLPNNSATITLSNADSFIVDSATYVDSVPEGQSWERASFDSNRFSEQPYPNPKNSLQ